MTEDSTTGETGFAPDEPTLGAGSYLPIVDKGAGHREIGITARLRRVTSSGRFIPEIDGLRFIAIMSVILFHLSRQMEVKTSAGFSPPVTLDPFAKILRTGHVGVQLFFVLSGFILALPFASHYLQSARPVSLRAFYVRRLTRLEPPYLLSLFLYFALLIVIKKEAFSELFTHLLASAFYLHNIIYGDGSTINYVAWSLEVEVQFYLLAPFIAAIFRLQSSTLRRTLLLSFIMLLVFAQAFWLSDTKRVLFSILGQGQFFLTGFLLADFYLTDWQKTESSPNPWRWDIVSFVGWPLLFVVVQNPDLAHWVLPFAIFILYTAVFRGHWIRRLLSGPLLTAIGGMCYSLYLVHFQVISGIWRLTSSFRVSDSFAPNYILQLGLMLPAIFGVSAIFYLLIEKPCMNRDWPSRASAKLRLNSRKPVESLRES